MIHLCASGACRLTEVEELIERLEKENAKLREALSFSNRERLEKELAGHRKALNAAKLNIRAKEAIQAMTSVDQCHLEEALNTLQSERDANALLTQELAESQAREAKLREALQQWVAICNSSTNIRTEIAVPLFALQMPHDDTALKEYKRKVLLDAAKVAYNFEPDKNGPIETGIRRMAEEV